MDKKTKHSKRIISHTSISTDHRHADEPDGDDDGPPSATHHRPSQDDERPRDEEGDGADAAKHERTEPGQIFEF